MKDDIIKAIFETPTVKASLVDSEKAKEAMKTYKPIMEMDEKNWPFLIIIALFKPGLPYDTFKILVTRNMEEDTYRVAFVFQTGDMKESTSVTFKGLPTNSPVEFRDKLLGLTEFLVQGGIFQPNLQVHDMSACKTLVECMEKWGVPREVIEKMKA